MNDKNKSILLHIRPVEVSVRYYSEIINNNNYDQVNQKRLKLNIRKVIFNNPATIVFWLDGTKTIVKKADDEPWDPEKGLAMAIIKKYFGTNKEIKKIILALEK